jgi:aquaporin Z
MLWEALLTVGLVSTILGTASGAQQVGPFAAIGVGSYIALAGLWASPVSGTSMNPARSLGPALVLGDWTSWWAYLAGPVIGAAIAVGIAYVLRGPGGGTHGTEAAQGTLGTLWLPTRIGRPMNTPDFRPGPPVNSPRGGGDQGGEAGGERGNQAAGERGNEAGGERGNEAGGERGNEAGGGAGHG